MLLIPPLSHLNASNHRPRENDRSDYQESAATRTRRQKESIVPAPYNRWVMLGRRRSKAREQETTGVGHIYLPHL
jgi:hypothetical protein